MAEELYTGETRDPVGIALDPRSQAADLIYRAMRLPGESPEEREMRVEKHRREDQHVSFVLKYEEANWLFSSSPVMRSVWADANASRNPDHYIILLLAENRALIRFVKALRSGTPTEDSPGGRS